MKTIGMIGGMSWESTALYYQIINRTVQETLGGLHSAKIVLHSFDFHEIEQLQHQGDWHTCGMELARVAASLEAAGAELLVLCTNTMHLVAPAMEAATNIPLLHIADPTARRIKHSGLSSVGLLGTRFTMEQTFYRDRMTDKHGIEVITPDKEARDTVHRIIYDELCKGKILPESRAAYRNVMADLAGRGAQGIILGCTEITMLVDQGDSPVPLFDTTAIHAQEAALEACRSDVRQRSGSESLRGLA